MWGGVINDKVCSKFCVCTVGQKHQFSSLISISKYWLIPQKKSITFALNRSQKEFFLKRFIPKAYDSCIEKKTKTQKTGMIYLTVAKKICADFFFRKRGIMNFGKLFLFREKVNGNFYLVRKNRLFFVGLLVYNSTHLLKSTMLFWFFFWFWF